LGPAPDTIRNLKLGCMEGQKTWGCPLGRFFMLCTVLLVFLNQKGGAINCRAGSLGQV